MSGTGRERPYGTGPYGVGPYSRYGAITWDAAGLSSITFNVHAGAGLVHLVAGKSQIAFNVVSRGVSLVMHANALTDIAWDVQAEMWRSWGALQPCEGGVWTPAVPCEPGGWAPPPGCAAGTWTPVRYP